MKQELRQHIRLTWRNKMELADKGYTEVWFYPHRNPDTDEVSFGQWAIVIRHKGKLVVIDETIQKAQR